ncbi:unnamed protein product [Blepharisma stoltei]|uniref:Uncharacterized protein n=1 Tax=Blepharisma stoltei TaxID=1481888 RepID=A0AAU9JVT8_9CILI|nr:unnamed protein product [Blepharisma stoltei]
MYTLELLLIEMLGTNEDIIKFKAKYSLAAPAYVKSLLGKCLDLYGVRKKTIGILKRVHLREKMIKHISKAQKEERKEIAIKICKANKILKEKIQKWVDDLYVPFESFIYGGKDYLRKIEEDMVYLQTMLE